MREILFRGKAINRDKGYHRTNYKNGDWVYGLITRLYDEQFENLPAEMTDMGVNGIEIDYKTIGQYTGLTDKNGTKIFEGDIGRYKQTDGAKINGKPIICIGKVVYNEKTASFAVDSKDEIGAKNYDYFPIKDFEIIGNIHDNPELLKGGGEE